MYIFLKMVVDISDMLLLIDLFVVFFFQAEDRIRDAMVTGVQTCALPICPVRSMTQAPRFWSGTKRILRSAGAARTIFSALPLVQMTSESAFTPALQLM